MALSSPRLSEFVRAVRTVDELPKFTPSFTNGGKALVIGGSTFETTAGFECGGLWGDVKKDAHVKFNEIGGDITHNNLPCAVAAYVWKRTA